MPLTRTAVTRLAFVVGALVMLHGGSTRAEDSETVVLDSRRYAIVAGRFSEFATFQNRLRAAVEACGRGAELPPAFTPNGRIGPDTEAAIRLFAACRGEATFPETSKARQGVLTTGVWKAVMGAAPVPDATTRAHAMVLSFEGTDFGDAPEWNLCQDGMRQGPRGQVLCFNSSDPCSYLTWGPRGATVGSGREIQYILAEVGRRNPQLLQHTFGAEYPTLARLYRAKSGPPNSCTGQIPVKVLVCSIWSTPERRAIWDNALKLLGTDAGVRQIYDKLYTAEEFDGGKMRAFFALWTSLGLPVSEVDLAYFLDRITHLGGPPPQAEIKEKMEACMRDEKAVSRHGAARRCLSRLQTHATQPDYRTARDVGYYLDAYTEGEIAEREIKLWASYMALSAVHNFGLRDDVAMPLPKTETVRALGMELPPEADGQVLPSEAARCPAAVLTPLPKKP